MNESSFGCLLPVFHLNLIVVYLVSSELIVVDLVGADAAVAVDASISVCGANGVVTGVGVVDE